MATPRGLFDLTLVPTGWVDATQASTLAWFDDTLADVASGGAAYTETGTVAADAVVTGSDAAARVETGTAAAGAVVTASDSLNLGEAGIAFGWVVSTGADLLALIETATAAGEAVVVGRDEAGADVPQVIPWVEPASVARGGQFSGAGRTISRMSLRIR